MERDMLYLACTRGAKTYGGVPALGFGINFTVCYLGYMIPGGADLLHFRGFIWLVIGPAVHFAMRAMVERDPNIFRIVQTMFDSMTLASPVLWAAPWRFSRRAL